MIVLPDGKVCRNLPEQVAENLKKIQEIITFLDGVNIQDNLVVVNDISQTLTMQELEIVLRQVAFIYYNDELYIKEREASGMAYFDNVFTISDAGTQLDFESKEIEVNLLTGALSYSNSTVSTYSKSQADGLLAAKASLSGAAFTGDVSAKTLEQNEANWSQDITSFPNITGGIASPIFCRVQQINQELHLIFIGKIVNNSGSTISGYGTSRITVSLPTAIASKIYDLEGNTVAQSLGSVVRISAGSAFVSKANNHDISTVQNDVYFMVLNVNTANQVGIQFSRGSQLVINDGETMYFEGRVYLDLL